jgi:4-amino-4-deoxy-L-arabinose transferase-like glycosyltransferase
MIAVELSPTQAPSSRRGATVALLGLWMLSLVILLAALGVAPVSRTQEARVLETARQMLGGGIDGWLVPHINNQLRLEKPPLCYWMAAGMYELSGTVNETVGRVPTAIIGWLLLGMTYLFARQLFDHMTGLASAGVMLGSLMFFRHMRLAETDAPAALFVTIAIYGVWRSIGRSAGWLHLTAAATALALMAKGGPAVYVLLFAVGWGVVQKDWSPLRRFFTRGAVLTFAILALPWFIYIAATLGTAVFRSEVSTVTTGRNHWDLPIVYIPLLLAGVAPWSAILPLAMLGAWEQRDQRAIRLLALWILAILLPLCLIGNKQGQYLVPVIPPVMMLIGWTIVRGTQRASRLFPWVRGILIAMIALAALSEAAIMFIALQAHQQMTLIDALTIGCIGTAATVTAAIFYRNGAAAAFASLIACTAALMPLVMGVWLHQLSPSNPRTIARQIDQTFGQADYVFFGPNVSLPLCFNLRAKIPWAQDMAQLPALVRPGTVVIAQTKSNQTPPPLPAAYVHRLQIRSEDQIFDLYAYQPD